jgi:hypothetical protein
MEALKTMKTKATVSKKSNDGGITVCDFTLYYRAITTKRADIGTKPDTKNRRPRHKCPNYSHLIFGKGAQNIHCR